MFRTLQRSTITRSLAAAAAAVTIAAVGAAPALAWTPDYPFISTATEDFGGGPFLPLVGAPAAPGRLDWNTPLGVVTPHLTGNLYATNLGGVRLRMRMTYYDSAYQWITTEYGGIVTPASNALHTWSVDLEPFGAINIFHVKVAITQESVPGSGNFVRVGAEYAADI
jgi:hypothetical protein